jgi:hypothetical protein
LPQIRLIARQYIFQVTMAKRRTKKRTHVALNSATDRPGKPGAKKQSPKSMVIRMGAGDVGSSVSQLAKDFRAMMEPDTASRLKAYILVSKASELFLILVRNENQINSRTISPWLVRSE